MKAALLIQRWYRQYVARMEIRRRYTWTIFQSIEYADEHAQLQVDTNLIFFSILISISITFDFYMSLF